MILSFLNIFIRFLCQHGYTDLMKASESGYSGVVNLLLSSGAVVDVVDAVRKEVVFIIYDSYCVWVS